MTSENIASNAGVRRNVVITGFGLFRGHELNPSWEAIKDDRIKSHRPNINIIKQQVDVAYDEVDNVVQFLWDTYDPLLMIHIGLAAHETAIRIERKARHGPYIHDDVRQRAPHKELRVYNETGDGSVEEQAIKHEYTCAPCSFECSRTCFDVDKVCETLNKISESECLKLQFKKSEDAGLYVCEYIYQKSLNICDRTIFLHVPNIKDSFTLDDITSALQHAIKMLIEEAQVLV